eukprot:TRINITY_DN16759_c0_g1_i4.p1 TRINITY_DN16759_c0_g1~~TRINITY_DN16759_c0_g1_i4.p1  ORF type:complete len:1198 (+),score=368.56 TRINITY_DN16759_c0_g1_i4:83-3595(+)
MAVHADPGPVPLEQFLDGRPITEYELSGADPRLPLLCGDGGEGDCCAAAFAARFALYAERPCLGTRTAEGRYDWVSYGALQRRAAAAAAGLAALGLGRGDLVGIIGANSIEWFVADLACLFAGAVSVPLSETWDPETFAGVAHKCGVKCIIADPAHAPAAVSAARRTPCIRAVAVSGGAEQVAAADPGYALSAPAAGGWFAHPIEVRSLEHSGAPPVELVRRGPGELHTVLHTSGTTGLPKGVEYTDALWLRNMQRHRAAVTVGYSYMPLAYITDRHTVATTLWNGGRVGIAAAASGGAEGSADRAAAIFRDLQEVRPTVLKGVPKFWESVHLAARNVRDTGLSILGGRAHTLVCGAGALPQEVADWFRESCRVPVLQIEDPSQTLERPVQFFVGYGSTEAGNLAQNRRILPHVQWKLLPVEGLPADPDLGEFAVKTGDMMFSGYFREGGRTAEAFTEDGYYRLGDLVRITREADGTALVDVIGRAKSTIKLGNGRWVFTESLEDFYRQVPGVRYVWLYGDSSRDQLVGVVDAEAPGVSATEMLGRLRAHAAAGGRPAHEWVGEVTLARRPFSRGDRTLNGTGKLDRRELYREYAGDIEAMFQRIESHAGVAVEGDAAQPLRAQGGSSLHAARIAKLYKELGVPVERSIALLLQGQHTLAEAGAALDAEVRDRRERELDDADPDAEAALGLQVPAPSGQCDAPGVLVTGATGFVGAHLAHELRARGLPVWCLARAPSLRAAQLRMQRTLAQYGLLSWEPGSRRSGGMEVLCGDAARKELGVDLGALRGRVGAIVHCAAVVDLAAGYARHRRANVLGTLEACRAAALLGARLFHVSTTDVMPRRTSGPYERFDLALTPEEAPDRKHGYARSKWISERVVATASGRGLRSCVLRLGMVGAHSRTGVCAAKDWVPRLLIGIAHTGAVPVTDSRHTLPHSLPVDAAAQALAALVQAPHEAVGGKGITVASLAPLLTIRELAEQLRRFGGPYANLQELPFAEWIRRVESDAALSAWPLLTWASGMTEFPVFNVRPVADSPTPGVAAALAAGGGSAAAALAALREGVTEAGLGRQLLYLFFGRPEAAAGRAQLLAPTKRSLPGPPQQRLYCSRAAPPLPRRTGALPAAPGLRAARWEPRGAAPRRTPSVAPAARHGRRPAVLAAAAALLLPQLPPL